jgi:hypothetical protein
LVLIELYLGLLVEQLVIVCGSRLQHVI